MGKPKRKNPAGWRTIEIVKAELVTVADAPVPESIGNSEDTARIIREVAAIDKAVQEHMVVLSLSTRNDLWGIALAAVGGVNQVSTTPADVLRFPILHGAPALIIAHNHPSGDPQPSDADKRFTDDLSSAAKSLGLRLIDHLIIGRNGRYYSFVDEGLLHH